MFTALILSALLGPTPSTAATSQFLSRAGGKMTGSLRLDAHTIAADDVTPSVLGANIFVTSANTGATAITDLDDGLPGQVVTICGGSNTNSSTIADSGNFALNGAVTLSLDSCIDLWITADNDYVELGRTVGGGWTATATSSLDMATHAISFGSDPADAGDVRLENNTSMCWEASPAGTDACLTVGTGEELTISAKRIVLDTGAANPQEISFGSSQGTRIYGQSDGAMTFNAGSTTALTLTAGNVSYFGLRQADVTSSCTAKDIVLDTGGTPEICVCQSTNTWYCVAVTDTTGPAD